MLTADLVTARRRGSELRLVPLSADMLARAEELTTYYLEIARAHLGRSREELEAAWEAVAAGASERRLAAGLRKLVGDRCTFAARADVDPLTLRRALFQSAVLARRALPPGSAFDRGSVLESIAQQHGLTVADLEAILYADLRGAERLCEVAALSPARLAAGFDLSQAQGVLLRAVRVVAEVRSTDPARTRALFRKLKFLRLLHTIAATPKGGYRIEIDGPFSLFQAVTRYGLQLGMALPAIADCEAWQVAADVLWGQQRQPLRFRWSGGARATSEPSPSVVLPDEVSALLVAFNNLDSPWRARVAASVLELPGVGLCVPDLVFHHAATRAEVFLEVLGFWSREAVWKRVELVRAGLPHPILFAVSKQLRVSEAALGVELPAALYVYSRVMSASAVLERLQALAEQGSPRPTR